VVGSPTFNNGILPTITPVLEDLRGLKFLNKIGAAFVHTDGAEGVSILEEHLNKSKVKIVAESVKAKWQPREEDLGKCRELGQKIALAIKAD
jgi:flavorubredoxin